MVNMDVKSDKREERIQEMTEESPSLVSLAKQVSFPNWNVMVGNLGDKFTRRELEMSDSSSNKNINGKRHKDLPNKPQTMNISSTDISEFEFIGQNQSLKEDQETVKVQVLGNPATNISTRRMRTGRKLGIVSMPVPYDTGQDSSLNIHTEEEICETNIGNAVQNFQPINPVFGNASCAPDLAKCETSINSGSSDNEKDASNHRKNSKPKPEFIRPPFRKRSMSYSGGSPIRVELTSNERDTVRVLIASPALKTRSNHFNFDRVTNSEGKDSIKAMRRGTIDVAALGRSKSPKLDRRNRKSDPSHYLMQNGKRRGSYNPTYNQSTETLNKGKQRNSRAQSMFTPTEDSIRKALVARLMAHVSPELKASLELQEDMPSNTITQKDHPLYSLRESSIESSSDSENAKENDNINSETQNMDINRNVKKGISPGEMTRQKINVSKSSSFGSLGELNAMVNDKQQRLAVSPLSRTKRVNMESQIRHNRSDHLNPLFQGESKDLTRQIPMQENDDGLSSDASEYTDSETNVRKSNLIDKQRHSSLHRHRKAAHARSVSPKSLHRNLPDQVGRDFRARTTRGQSSFDGVQASFLSHLREKDAERKRKDSIRTTSSSSSDDGDTTRRYPLHTAAKRGNTHQLQQLIVEGHAVNAVDEQGWPAIHYALASGHFDCVAKLMNAGANIRDYSTGRTLKYFK